MKQWMFNEFEHCGVNYAKGEQAAEYDDNHQSLRNYDAEFASMLGLLGIPDTSDMTVADIGCGTGITSIQLAEKFKRVIALDVSEAMLTQARKKAASKNMPNIDFIRSGFLSYAHNEPPVDLVITKTALHHLPDFWKQVALLRINAMLKPDGLLYLLDVVFNFDARSYQEKIDAWVQNLAKAVPPAFVRDIETHISSEYSTFRWILDGMLEKSGFVIEKWRSNDGFIAEYVCRKSRDAG